MSFHSLALYLISCNRLMAQLLNQKQTLENKQKKRERNKLKRETERQINT